MKTKSAISGNWIKAATIGAVCAIVISAVLTGFLSSLTLKGKIGDSGIGYAVFAIRLLSVAVGGLIGTGIFKEKLLAVVGTITAAYMVVLIAIGIAFLDGSFNRFGMGLISVVLGGAVAAVFRLMPNKNKNRVARLTR